MIEGTTKFDLDFQISQLALAFRDFTHLSRLFMVVGPDDFSDPKLRWFARKMKDISEVSGKPSVGRLMTLVEREVKDEDDQAEYLALLEKIATATTDEVRSDFETLTEYAQFKSLEKAMLIGADKLDKWDVAAAKAELTKGILATPDFGAYLEVDWFGDFEERMKRRKHRKDHPEEYIAIKHGISALDKITGGLRDGELGLVVAPTGRGKSIFLVHLAFMAVLQGYNVLFLTLEMPTEQVASRFDSRFLRMPYDALKNYDLGEADLESIWKSYHSKKEDYTGRLKIVEVPIRGGNIMIAREIIARRKALGIPTHAVFFDSGDHLNPVVHYKDFRLQQSAVYWDMKALAGTGCAVWSSTHSKQEFVAKRDDKGRVKRRKWMLGEDSAGESHDKSRIADMIVTLNESGYPDGSTAFLAKYRDGASRIPIRLSTSFEIMMYKEMSDAEHEEKLKTAGVFLDDEVPVVEIE